MATLEKELTRLGFQKPKRLVAVTETLTDRYGMFYAQPFERGWGTTIGNSLRRILLSSIEGAAITAVKIHGIAHEFSPIPGVTEDATDLILNLKQVPFKILGGGLVHTARLVVEEPGEVYSRHIQTDSNLEVVDPDVYIATVGEGRLEVEMRVKLGRGYVSAERNFDDDLPLGYIPIDSVHSPVRKVNYTVENARLGQITEYDKLTLEVWTNGTISPQDAISRAARLLRDHLTIFITFEELEERPGEEQPVGLTELQALLNKRVDELELSVRSYNCLKNANIQTIGDLIQKTEAELLRTRNFGRKSLAEIKELLAGMGLELGMRFDSQGRLLRADGTLFEYLGPRQSETQTTAG